MSETETHTKDVSVTDQLAEAEAEPEPGLTIEVSDTITDSDVRAFADLSGDENPVHLDAEYAEQTRFNGRIAHGMLGSSLISAALARLPGVAIYLSQDLEFQAPIGIGDDVTATVEIVEDVGGNRYRLETVVENDHGVVIDGEAVVLLDDEIDGGDA